MRHGFNSSAPRRLCLAILAGILVCSASAQTTPPSTQGPQLTLDDALKMTKERNGTVKAAYLDVQAARQRVIQAQAAFFPVITPEFVYRSSAQQVASGGNTGFISQSGSQTLVSSSITLLDAGERQWTLLGTRASQKSQQSTALNTLRNTLFTVQQQYFDALRSQELLRVADLQVTQAQTILDATQYQVKVGAAAGKDVLQVQADLANAKVQQLVAKNSVSTSQALLKATIGWDSTQPLPQLANFPEPTNFPSPGDLQDNIKQGLEQRPDLIAERQSVRSQHFNVLVADRNASISFNVGFNFNQEITPHNLQDHALTLNLSLPFLDGGRARAAAREQQLNYEASQKQLQQDERTAQSDIESAYAQLVQDAERVQAADAALKAAQENYEAAVGSQKAGAGNILDVLTAQVSLITAESNSVQANFDYYISQAQLKLVTGQPMPGESS